ncbi:MAG: SDR family oxidoreductase, partial [Coriobacteriia bacterium]|nr:SDR family oxidoreductase [Coriobacteriia bacterium]
ILGLVGFAQSPAYVTAKHGVMGLTKAAAIEYAQAGIRVNAINPGFIETQLLTDAGITPGSDLYAFLASKHAMNRLGQPDEIGKMIVMLCSDEASFVTGIPFPVDGGYTAQ